MTTLRLPHLLTGLLFHLCLVFTSAGPLPIIIDTDANNELDDQHALAYAVMNPDAFDIIGVTVNRTKNGGDVKQHMEEAIRVLLLCRQYPDIAVYPGASGTYEEIQPTLDQLVHDGSEAVDFIIREARKPRQEPLILVPIGKLTNITLALEKAPDIVDKVRVVWLGSNFPDEGEYNLINDISAINPMTRTGVHQEWVTVRYGKPSGSDAVKVTPDDIQSRMKGKGPRTDTPVEGRHGGTFSTFGDYAFDLFQNIELYSDPPSRALFDVVALAILKNPEWGQATTIPAPVIEEDGSWAPQYDRKHTLVLWENFDIQAIIDDFFGSFE